MSEQRRKTQSSHESENTGESRDASKLTQKGKKIGEELDALLGEIDDVLEENAADFVASYVQHGGE
ncbi:MAG TPA: ubiquitin-like protein Pup [Terriglobales bacterium]|nr:ubiquitin-like protein Pup [Rectinemataceae bacterium]HUO64879.1 ubiquitin-like protein Pup [Terriglobales bacterium]